MEKLIIRDAYEHNLKHIDLDIPSIHLPASPVALDAANPPCVRYYLCRDQRGFLEGMTGNLYGQKR